MSDEIDIRRLSAGFPTYAGARQFVRILNDVPFSLYRSMENIIWEQRGTPQENVDWSDPGSWIFERLEGAEQELAQRIWQESNHLLNPRFVWGHWELAKNHKFLAKDEIGVLRLTVQGNRFLNPLDQELIAEIDNYEGVLNILQIVAERSPGKRSAFVPDYAVFCRTYTTYRSDSVINGSLYDRLMNLIERQYIIRKGQTYEVTDSGLAYLDVNSHRISGRTIGDKQPDLLRLAKTMNGDARDRLAEFLINMDPFKFEELIKLLLEKMGYDNVETTSHTNDKGVDVVADIKLGISQVREVVQVKRYSGNISRPVLDGLRGSLHRFRAVRGTIITTGGFSRGTIDAAFEIGAAPITLIDGDRLLDLLIENEIGISRKSVEYIEFDPAELTQFDLKEVFEQTEQ